MFVAVLDLATQPARFMPLVARIFFCTLANEKSIFAQLLFVSISYPIPNIIQVVA